jgi:PAS domain S-box-containing protein
MIANRNRGAERTYGYSAADAVGRHISFCYPPEKRMKVHAFLQKIANGEAIERFDTQRITKDGLTIDVSLSVGAMKDGTGKVVGTSGIARDITAYRRTARQLQLQSTALEAAANAIVITDRHGTIVGANHAFTTMTGYSKEEVLGKNFRLLKSGEQPESYYANLWSTISSGSVWQGEIVNRRKDGTIYTEEMTITPVTQGVGSAADTHFIAIKQDITERKKAEEELQRLAAIVEFSEDAIISKNMDGVITSWNRGAEKMYGYTEGEVVGRDLSFLLPPERQAEIQAIMERVLSGQPVECLETQRLTKTGSVLDVSLSVSLIKDAGGHIAGASAIARDITQRKAAEKQVQFLAYYDALTGLSNRTLLQDRLTVSDHLKTYIFERLPTASCSLRGLRGSGIAGNGSIHRL